MFVYFGMGRPTCPVGVDCLDVSLNWKIFLCTVVRQIALDGPILLDNDM